MKDYKRLTKWSNLGTLHILDFVGKEIPLCDVSALDIDNLAGRLVELEDKIENGEIDYVADRDEKIEKLTAENDNLTVELEVAQRDIDNLTRTLEEANDEIKALEAENAELKATISKMETVEKELRARMNKAIELPCKVGDKLFVVMPELYGNQIIEALVNQIIFNHGETQILVYYDIHQEGRIHELYERFLGKTVFLTREAAEKRLA